MSDNIHTSANKLGATPATPMPKSIYFVGIGGIGMSAIARYFHARGVSVCGYDKTETELTKKLVAEGIAVHYNEDVDRIPKDADIVVYTPAIPKDHKELLYYQNNGFKVVKRSDILQIITENSFNICVAGTHGKTTTTTMIAHLLRDSGYGCNAFLGGISANYNTNFWADEKNVCVIEADEYDRSFLKLSPDTAVVTAMDADHLDIYETEENVMQAFSDFAGRVKQGGLLLKKFGLNRQIKATHTLAYSLQNDSADVYAANIQLHQGGYLFDVVFPDDAITGLHLYMGGMHNVENMVAAIAVAHSLKIDNEKIKNAVASFKGVKRRFEYVINKEDLIFVDDYAHHPEELKALINSVRSLFPQKKCTVIFQPHLYSRTKDFAPAFAAALDMAHQVILLPIYPARELPIEGVSANTILQDMNIDSKAVMDKDTLLHWIQNNFNKNRNTAFGEVIVTAGAGDIDKLVLPIKKILES
ncbi:MAG: UDP-N-acetylmuramate--L-alanine ligase [Niabella sp.]